MRFDSLVCALLLSVAAASHRLSADEATLLVTPESAGVEAARDPLALRRWAETNQHPTWSWFEALVVDMPLRLDDGGKVSRLNGADAMRRAWSLAEDKARAALADGQVVLESELGTTAAAALRGGMPEWFVMDARIGRIDFGPPETASEEARRAHQEAVRGRRLTDEEWQAQRASEDQTRRLRELLPWLDWEFGLSFAMFGGANLRLPDQSEVGMACLFGPDARNAPAGYVRHDDELGLAASNLIGRAQLGDLLTTRLSELEPVQPTLVTEEARLYSLAELTRLLSAWRPHRVAPAFADERVYVSAGSWNPSVLAQALSLASGLCWQLAGGELTLTTYPAAVALAPDPATGPWASTERLQQAIDWREVPFTPADMVSAEGPRRHVPYSELPEAQQAYLSQVFDQMSATDFDLARRLPDLSDPRQTERIGVELRLFEAWRTARYYPAGVNLGQLTFGTMHRRGDYLIPRGPLPWP